MLVYDDIILDGSDEQRLSTALVVRMKTHRLEVAVDDYRRQGMKIPDSVCNFLGLYSNCGESYPISQFKPHCSYQSESCPQPWFSSTQIFTNIPFLEPWRYHAEILFVDVS